MWHEIFNSILVGMGGLCIWVFKYHYQRFMAAHDLQRKADAEWRKSVDHDLARLKRVAGIADAPDASARKDNGLDRTTNSSSHGTRGRLRD